MISKSSHTRLLEKANTVLDKIRPHLIADGGNVEVVRLEDDILYVRLTGNCAHCDISSLTMKAGVEQVIKMEISEIKEVKNVDL